MKGRKREISRSRGRERSRERRRERERKRALVEHGVPTTSSSLANDVAVVLLINVYLSKVHGGHLAGRMETVQQDQRHTCYI